MKKNFKGLFGAFLANTPPCKLSFTSRKILCALFLVLFSVSNVWGETVVWNPSSAVSSDKTISQTLDNAIVISAYSGATIEQKQMDSSKKAYGIKIGASANSNLGAGYVEIKVNNISSDISNVLLGTSSNGDAVKKYGVVYFSALEATKEKIISGETLSSISKKSGSIDDRQQLNVPKGTKMIRIYRKINTSATGLANDLGEGSTIYVYSFSVDVTSSTPETTYAITYNLGDGTGTIPTQDALAEGKTFTLHNGVDGITAPAGKGFAGWNDGTTTYEAGATYTMPASDVTLTAQWKTLPNATFNNGEYLVGSAGLDLSTLFSSDSDGEVIYSVESNSNATITGSVFSATRAGRITVVAKQSATSTYAGITKTAYVDVTYPATGNATITYVVGVGSSQTALVTQDKYANSASISALSDLTLNDLTISDKGKDNSSPKISTPIDKDNDKYLYLTFTIADGYQFKISEVNTKIVAVSTTKTIEVVLSDNTTTETDNYSQNNNNDPGADHKFEFSGVYSGTVTLKLYVYGADNAYRLGKPLTIVGEVQPESTKYTVTYSANGGTGEMTQTTNEIVASTFTAPSGKMFKEWNTAADGNGTSYAAGDEVTKDLTLFAIWQDIQNFDVKFYPGYGENTQIGETQSVILGGKAEKPADPTREGYRFVGWSTDGTEANIKTIEDYAIIEATTFTAVWKQVYTVSFDLQGHGAAIEDVQVNAGGTLTQPADPTAIGWEFGGWYTEAECTNVWDFATVLTGNITLYAKWTKFDGCVVLAPATTSGTTPASKANVELQTGSYGGKIIFAGAKDDNWAASFAYTENGLALQKGGADSIRVQLDYQMKVGTKLTFVVYTANNDRDRGFYLKNSSNETKSTFAANLIGETMYTYTVEEGDGLAGNSVFILGRNQTAYLKSIKVTNCGGKIVSVNYAITPTEAADKATVILSANTSVEGQTITATYSNIASGWDFDKWEVNCDATMDYAQANPVTITMGAENPTVTLVLKPGAIKHTVSFDAQGGSTVEDQLVEENGNPTLPAEPTKEDYIFKGWAETVGGSVVDVTSFAITEQKTFYAIWEADGAIKLLDKTTGAINTTDFITGVSANDNIDGEKGATWGGTQGSISGANALNKVVQYNAKTNKTKIQVSFYNKNSGDKVVYLHKIVEGETTAVVETLTVAKKSRYTSEYYEFNNEKNRSIYLTTNSTDVQILQVKVIESGEQTLRNAGQVGYSLNLKKGRVLAYSGTEIVFEGLKLKPSSNYSVINSEELQIKSNLSFSIESPVLLRVETNAAKYYISQNSAEDGTSATAITETGVNEFELNTSGTWYIVPSTTSAVKITKIEFLAPKCDAPVFNALANSDICSGDPYVALNGTGTVTDEGTITYKWYAEGGTDVLGTGATYTPTADGSYYVVATNSLAGYTDNVVQSEVVTVTTHSSAAITTAPENVRQDVGTNATLAVVATGKNVTYQWYTCEANGNNATEIAGATAASYEVTVDIGVQYYKVVVSSDCGSPVEAVVKVEEWTELPLADVTGAITWDFSKAVTAETTLSSGDAEIVLANVAGVALNGEFESNKLKVAGTLLRTTYIQAKKLMFHATIPGKVTIEFSNTGNKEYDRILYVNGVATTAKSKNQDHITYSIVVPAGDVVIQAWEEAAQPEKEKWNLLNIYSLSFSMADYIRTGLTVGSLGTICLPSNVPAGHAFGATFYELKGKEPQYGKIVFDEILSGELAAGKPYLFQAQSDVLYCFYGTESVSDPDNSGAMKGTFVNLTLTNLTNIYYFAQKALWSCVDLTSLSVPANRAYVQMDEMPDITESNPAPGVRRITLGVNGQQVATGVDQVQGDEVPTKMIINGQLFILRGKKMYDAQGKLVK